jgi:serine-type D-Ala-D-Ala carboxypeptidase (penicillin-binding protein 5/6)
MLSVVFSFGVELRASRDTFRALNRMKYSPIFRNLAVLALLFPWSLSAQSTESIMVVEAHSGKILIAKNSNEKRPIASLTKIAMAAVTVDWSIATGTDLGTTLITAPQTVALVGGPNPMNLAPGDQFTLRDALYSALLGSDNLAALAISDHVGREIMERRGDKGDPVAIFVGEMNQLAKALEMKNTKFANPHGLERAGAKAYSTASDVARLSIYAMTRNAFSFIVRQADREVSVTGSAGKRSFRVKNTNELVGEPGILGVKTGTTNAAGPCLAVCMDRDPLVRTKPDGSKGVTPRRLIVVLLNDPDRFDSARSALTQAWNLYDPWLDAGAPVQDREKEILSVKNPQ